MSIVTLNLDINENQLEDYLVSNINDLPKDKIEDILLKAVEVALIADKEKPRFCQNTNILVKESNKTSYYNEYVPTPILKSIIEKFDVTPYFEPIAKEICEYITENYKDIVQEYIIKSFTNMLISNSDKYSIQTALNCALNK